MTDYEKRWLEVQFYYTCTDILKLKNEPTDLMTLIELLAPVGQYRPNLLIRLAYNLEFLERLKPTKPELIYLMMYKKFTIREIKTKAKLSGSSYCKFVKEKDTEYYPCPKLSDTMIEQIQLFLNSITRLKGVGL